MALLIKPTKEKLIYVQGTTIGLPQVYNRLEFGCRPNGITIEVAFYTYETFEAYESGSSVPTDIPTGNLTADIDPLTQTQNVETAHELAKTYYEDLGYEVIIDLV
jgi:hypothetical protein